MLFINWMGKMTPTVKAYTETIWLADCPFCGTTEWIAEGFKTPKVDVECILCAKRFTAVCPESQSD